MDFLFIGDVVGRSGRKAVKTHLAQNKYDFVICNVENAAAGFGVTNKVYHDLKDTGIDVMTGGNHTWDKKETETYIEEWDRFVRPANISDKVPGKGYKIFNVMGKNICVINLLGRVFMNGCNCPFQAFDNIYSTLPDDCFTVVDFHAEATSEKIAFGYYAAGRADVVTGTHTHVQTNDIKLINNTTLYVTDAGMCGAYDSILGMEKEQIVERFVTNIPKRFCVETKGSLLFNGFTFSINNENRITNYSLINKVYDNDEVY